MASHLGRTVDELKELITQSEFLDWIEFIRREESRRTKQDTYLAAIAAEVRRGYVLHPRKVKVEDFFLTTTTSGTGQDKVLKSKTSWLWAVGYRPEKK